MISGTTCSGSNSFIKSCTKASRILAGWLRQRFWFGQPGLHFLPPTSFLPWSFVAHLLHLKRGAGVYLAILYCCFFAAGLALYAYGRSHWRRSVALAAACLYALSPYLIFDIYQRGALTETFTFALIPLIFLVSEQAMDKEKLSFLIVIAFALLFLTNIPLSIFTLFFWSVSIIYFCFSATDMSLLLRALKTGRFFCLPLFAVALDAFYLFRIYQAPFHRCQRIV